MAGPARAGVLVYSANVAGLYTIRNKLEGAGISFSEIQGRSTTVSSSDAGRSSSVGAVVTGPAYGLPR